MPELRVGAITIPWQLRFSSRAKHKRIVVTPGRVEVVAPTGTPLDGDDSILAYVHEKRRWIYDAVRRVENRRVDELRQHYVNGAKLLYRGRRLSLDIRPADVEDLVVEYRSRFHVRAPRSLKGDDRRAAVRRALVGWMKDHAGRDARRWARAYSRELAVEPADVRLSSQRTMWGSCGKDGVLRINWQLVQAPAAAMEYVVAHEVCHLVERTHTDRFWRVLGEVMPDWSERKALLERWEREQMIDGRAV